MHVHTHQPLPRALPRPLPLPLFPESQPPNPIQPPTLTLTSPDPHTGSGRGSGLGGANTAFTSTQYGARGSIIDTSRPFRVHAHFEARTCTCTCNMQHACMHAYACTPRTCTCPRTSTGTHPLASDACLDVPTAMQATGGTLRGMDMTLAQGGRTLRFSPVPSHCLARHRCQAHAMRIPCMCLAHARPGPVHPKLAVLAWHSPFSWAEA